ncbi:unnamed protein product [Closterium sp. NIES-64]|nr:unnamed protein product [Closterium sp. NIES-64]
MVSYFLPCNQLGAGTRVGAEILTHSFRSALATHPDRCPFVQSLESARGSRQGDPLGPFLFAFTQQQVMEPVTREFKDLLFLSYADDTYILGPAARILEAFGVLRERLEWVGLEVQAHKCRFWEREGKEVERALPLGMQRVDEGLTVVGVPIGEEVWEVVRLRERLRQLQAPLPWLPLLDHPQMASHLLAIAVSARPMYLARTMPSRPEGLIEHGGGIASTPYEATVMEADRVPEADFRPTEKFDTLMEVFHFITGCNDGHGLSNDSTVWLLNLLKEERLNLALLQHWHTLHAVVQYGMSKLMATREYETHTFTLPNWATPFEVTATSGKEAVLELLRNPANAEGFVLFPREENSGAGRMYSTPETATYWEEAQPAAVAMFGEGTVVIPLILSSDATMLSGNERTKVRAVYISIANIPLYRRWQECGKLLLAMLPFPPSQMSSTEKTALFQAAMKIVLADLIVASHTLILHLPMCGIHTGMAATDPNGVARFVVPLLFSYVADYPETCKVSCTQQLGSVRPCSLCYVQREHLRDMDREAAEMRTVEKQEGVLDDPAEAALYATMRVPSFLWDFNFSRTVWGNTYLTMGPDILHAIFIGWWLYIRDALRGNNDEAATKDGYADISTQRAVPLATICTSTEDVDPCAGHILCCIVCRRQAEMYPDARIAGIAVPGSGNYWVSGANYTASEHAAVMMAITTGTPQLTRASKSLTSAPHGGEPAGLVFEQLNTALGGILATYDGAMRAACLRPFPAKAHTALAVPAGHMDLGTVRPHYVRAAASLHGHKAFSCVEYETAAGQVEHGRLLMLLEAEQDVPGAEQEVEVGVIQRLVDVGLDAHTGCRTLSAPSAMGGLAVIEVAAIRRAVHCVPSFERRGICNDAIRVRLAQFTLEGCFNHRRASSSPGAASSVPAGGVDTPTRSPWCVDRIRSSTPLTRSSQTRDVRAHRGIAPPLEAMNPLVEGRICRSCCVALAAIAAFTGPAVALPSRCPPVPSPSLPVALNSRRPPFPSPSLHVALPSRRPPFPSPSLPVALPSRRPPFPSPSLPVALHSRRPRFFPSPSVKARRPPFVPRPFFPRCPFLLTKPAMWLVFTSANVAVGMSRPRPEHQRRARGAPTRRG